LVDRSFVPGARVTEAGGCPWEVDVAGRDARASRLQGWLAHADCVLAPSASAASVLAANGIDAEVDENGLPPEAMPTAAGARPGRAPGPVRFTYAGGHLEMKGVAVLLDAARLLAERAGVTGWHLDAYGAEPFVAQRGIVVDGLPIDVPPPFGPGRLGPVLAGTDVLVLPSVMRETHSLLTREALAAGVPVVTSDSLGPEEVVTDGLNGLVVPTADAEALAAAMTRLVTDPDLLERLASHTGGGGALARSLEDQLDGLERRFDALVRPEGQATTVGAPSVPAVRSVVFMVGIQGAPLRYRAWLPAEALALLGVSSEVRYYRDHDLPGLVAAADALVVYRVPATHQALEIIATARARGIPVLFDVDDLIFDPDLRAEIPALRLLPPDEAELWLEGVCRYRTTLEHCDGYVGSTPMLVRHAASVTGLPASRFDNGVGLLLARRSDIAVRRPRTPGPLRIGYLSGTTTHDDDWGHIEAAVIDVLDAHRSAELWLGGYLVPTPALERLGERVRRLPFLPWTEVPRVVRDLDVNLAPLQPGSRFNEAKSAIKWLEAALCATVTVASPTEPFRDAVEPGVNGLLADTPEEWADALALLADDDLMRRRLAARARRDALLRWSPHLQGPRYLGIIEAARGWRDQRDTTVAAGRPWVPVVHDEPLTEAPLEAYRDDEGEAAATEGTGHSPAVATPSGLVPASVLARLQASLREDGARATVVKVARVARRGAGRLRRRARDDGARTTAAKLARVARLGAGRLRRRGRDDGARTAAAKVVRLAGRTGRRLWATARSRRR
ncbi:MAG: glycosyltransferase, partial [Acidimicrobiia bacterium]